MDYKTGRKTFDLTDIWNGMGLQMLLYLFTLERGGSALQPGDHPGRRALPARPGRGGRGQPGHERGRAPEKGGRRAAAARHRAGRAGGARRHGGAGEAGIRFLPVKVNKAGAITGEALVSAERLGKLARHTGRILEEIGRELAAGNIAADPFWRGPDHNACQWCEYAAACHFEEGRGGDRRRFLPAVRGEEFWQAVAKEQV
ncbi:MAG: PD-(D/E)XK nuclease family protein [Flavonifractor plautii]